MKKFLVITISAIMILSMAAVSMAAVTVGGESNFGWNMSPDTAQDEFGDAKVTVTADVNDSTQIFTALKGNTGGAVAVDEAWASFKTDSLTTKVGNFGFNLDGDVDIITTLDEIKQDAGISVAAKVSDAMTVSGYLARFGDAVGTADNEMQNNYALSVAYDTDSLGGKLAYSASTVEDTAGIMSLSGYYKMGAFKPYVTYESFGEQLGVEIGNNAVLGAMYDGEKIYGRAEFQVVQKDTESDAEVAGNQGFRIGYKINPNAKVEYNTKTIGDNDAESSIKLNVIF